MTTLRDKWKAFHRIYRLVIKNQRWFGGEEAFRTLFGNTRYFEWYDLLQSHDDPLTYRYNAPKFLRQRFLESDIRRRLYGELADRVAWHEQDQKVARQLAQEGIEMTPLEVCETRRKTFHTIRQEALNRGINLPQDDFEMLALLRKNLNHNE